MNYIFFGILLSRFYFEDMNVEIRRFPQVDQMNISFVSQVIIFPEFWRFYNIAYPLGDENRANDIYVPRDEAFSDIKLAAFDSKKTYSFVSTLPTLIETKFDGDKKFEYFAEIDELFDEDGFSIPPNLNE